MILFVIFDKKKNRIGVWFSCNFSGFPAIGTYIVTYGAGEKSCCQWCRFSYLWCNLVTKSKISCQWCTLAFGAVTIPTIHEFASRAAIFNNNIVQKLSPKSVHFQWFERLQYCWSVLQTIIICRLLVSDTLKTHFTYSFFERFCDSRWQSKYFCNSFR